MSERLSARDKEEKQAFEKPFKARQDGKTRCRAFIKATHALQNSKNFKNPLLVHTNRGISAVKLSGNNKAGKQTLRAFCKAIRAL